MKRKEIELLAPAGNMEALKAAVSAGCNAVYLGGTLFSARAFAGNFDHDEMIEAIRYCHIRGVSVYVTLNTLLFETEFENAIKEVQFLYDNDVDALLVQDLGLFHYLRQCFPDLAVHCSTQMHIHNPAGVRFAAAMGAERAVLARETPIEIIEECCKEDIDIEVFVYGALCISYSGQCLMSASLKNRSGNRGMCAQLCRLKYFADDMPEGKNKDGDYLLSPRDLNTLDRLPELLNAGVKSLKIEGRMKRPEYVYIVTRTFREAIDAWYEGREYHVSPERLKQMELMFHRGFTEGHIFHASVKERMNPYRPNHQGLEIGRVVDYKNGKVCVRLSDTLNQHDGLRILNTPTDTGLTAVRIEKNGRLVNSAEKGDTVWLDCRSKPSPRKGQPLHKTSDTVLIDEIDRMIEKNIRRTPIVIGYDAEPGQPLRLYAEDQEGHSVYAESEMICEEAKKAALTEERIEAALAKISDEPYIIAFGEKTVGNVFLPVSVINETRRQLLAAMNEARAHRHNRAGRKPYQWTVTAEETEHPLLLSISEQTEDPVYDTEVSVSRNTMDPDQKHYQLRSPVNEHDEGAEPLSWTVLSSVSDLMHPKENTIAGYTLNCCNSYALDYLISQAGVTGVILSTEVQNLQIGKMLEAFESRNGFVPCTYRLVYGRRVLMYIKEGIRIPEGTKKLRDIHENVFPLRYDGSLLEILEQEACTSDNPYCTGSCLIFTNETSGDRQAIKEEAYEELYQRI